MTVATEGFTEMEATYEEEKDVGTAPLGEHGSASRSERFLWQASA
jgi:hypothetical protein